MTLVSAIEVYSIAFALTKKQCTGVHFEWNLSKRTQKLFALLLLCSCDGAGIPIDYSVHASCYERHRGFVDVNLVPSPTGMRGIGR